MRKAACFIGTVLLVVCVTGIANASLVDQGSGVLLDDVAGQYWVQDLNKFNQKTYGDQITAIGAHTEAIGNTVLKDWRMADMTDVTSLLAAIGSSYERLSNLAYPSEVAFLEAGRTGYTWTSVWFSGRIEEKLVGKSSHKIWGYKQNAAYPDAIDGGHSDWIEDSAIAVHGAWVVMDQGSVDPDPVPEPATMLLFSLGLLGLAGVSRRKK